MALDRGRAHAESLDQDVAARISWTQADLRSDLPQRAAYDLVTMQFMQLPPAERDQVFPACIDAVAPGGALLIVAHHPQDMENRGVSPGFRTMFYTAERVAESLDDTWTVHVAQTRSREETDAEGKPVTYYDTVLLARRAYGDGAL